MQNQLLIVTATIRCEILNIATLTHGTFVENARERIEMSEVQYMGPQAASL